ncbi:EamA family transporter [Microcoleus sp. FACHB-SPT15]|uniref:DMT family transporter n=1 Tax=Microcoleus sp. FACHB-SPT15 TaxID=2692830 RepID=UPI001781E829|nr:EamA family transporter [Microcoleus sp. FACHB-SPT15]MBD1809670.1 EamA family transporter [Microcoleus sp. FACHB-SPT15]
MKTQLDKRTLVAAAVTLVCWASAFAGIRASLSAYTPGQIALMRFLVASVVLAVYAVITRMPLPKKQDLGAIAIIGFLGITAYHLLLNYGQLTVTAGAASLLVNTTPVFTALLAIAFLGERLSFRRWIGIAVSFTGAVVITGGEAKGFSLDFGALLILLSAVSNSGWMILQKPYLKKYSPLQLTTYSIWAGTLFLTPFLPSLLRALPTAPINATIAVIYLGVFPSAIAYATWAYVLAQIPASRAATLIYVVPVLAIFIAWVWLAEVPTILSLIGGAIVLSGVVLVNTGRRAEKPT